MAPTRRAGGLQFANISGTSATVAVPSAAVAGDVAIISYITTSTGSTFSGATGWAKQEYNGTTKYNLVVLSKTIAVGDPGSNVTLTSIATSAYAGTLVVSVEVWTGVQAPTATFARANGVCPSASALAGSIPLYIATAYDNSSTTPPSTVTAPTGLTGQYAYQAAYNSGGVGAWFGNPTTGTTASSVTFSELSPAPGLLATLILAPDPSLVCILAGAQAAADKTVQLVLAGANAAADTILIAQA